MNELSTERWAVRPMDSSDLTRVLAWRNHPSVRRYMYTQHEIVLEEHSSWFADAQKNPRKFLLIVEYANQPIGYVNFNLLTCDSIAEWGFYLAPDAPSGSGRKLGEAALNYAFSSLQFHKVCGDALAYNERSIRFHQSLGFTLEGTLRQQYFDGAGYHDIVCFGLLSHEWAQR